MRMSKIFAMTAIALLLSINAPSAWAGGETIDVYNLHADTSFSPTGGDRGLWGLGGRGGDSTGALPGDGGENGEGGGFFFGDGGQGSDAGQPGNGGAGGGSGLLGDGGPGGDGAGGNAGLVLGDGGAGGNASSGVDSGEVTLWYDGANGAAYGPKTRPTTPVHVATLQPVQVPTVRLPAVVPVGDGSSRASAKRATPIIVGNAIRE